MSVFIVSAHWSCKVDNVSVLYALKPEGYCLGLETQCLGLGLCLKGYCLSFGTYCLAVITDHQSLSCLSKFVAVDLPDRNCAAVY